MGHVQYPSQVTRGYHPSPKIRWLRAYKTIPLTRPCHLAYPFSGVGGAILEPCHRHSQGLTKDVLMTLQPRIPRYIVQPHGSSIWLSSQIPRLPKISQKPRCFAVPPRWKTLGCRTGAALASLGCPPYSRCPAAAQRPGCQPWWKRGERHRV